MPATLISIEHKFFKIQFTISTLNACNSYYIHRTQILQNPIHNIYTQCLQLLYPLNTNSSKSNSQQLHSMPATLISIEHTFFKIHFTTSTFSMQNHDHFKPYESRFEISNRHAHMHLKRHQTNITPPGSQITKFEFTLFSILQNLPAACSASHKLPQILQPKKKEKPNLDYVQNHELSLMQYTMWE
jgi:hypothetical protein